MRLAFMQEIAWFPKRSTNFTYSGKPLIHSKEDLWPQAHMKFSLTGWDVCKRSRLKKIISKSRFSIDLNESVGMAAKVRASLQFEMCRVAVRQGQNGQSLCLMASNVREASA